MWLGRCRSRGAGTDLGEVVGPDAVLGPDSGAFGAVDAGATPAVATLEGADASFTSGAPLDCSPERGHPSSSAPADRGSTRRLFQVEVTMYTISIPTIMDVPARSN